ncbi:hypothetical protein SAMN04487981_103576 [Streptomyces sp. cf386]|nr:hypothetical protein SAMN04487981_103576 [Streptomyces sp. cf386]
MSLDTPSAADHGSYDGDPTILRSPPITGQLNHVLSLLAHGLLTELPAQLATAAVMAAATAAWRYTKRRGAAEERDRPDADA